MNKYVTRLTSVLPRLQNSQFVGRRLVCLLFILVVVASLLLVTPYTASAHPLSGCPPTASLAATTWGNGRLDVFTSPCSTSGNTHYWQGPGEAGFHQEATNFGHNVSGLDYLSAVSSAPGRLDVFSVSNDGFFHSWQVGGSSFQRESMPAPYGDLGFVSPPVAVSWGPGRLDVFQISAVGQLYHYWQGPGEAGFKVESLGGSLAPYRNQLTAVTWGVGRLDVFATNKGFALDGSDHYLYHYWQGTGEAIFHRESLGTISLQTSTFKAVSWGPERLDLFAIASGQLVHYSQNRGTAFQQENLGGSFEGGDITAVTWGVNRLDAFAVGTNGQLYHFWKGPRDASFQQESLGGSWFSLFYYNCLAAVSGSPNRLDVFVVDVYGHYSHFWEDTGDTGFHQEVM